MGCWCTPASRLVLTAVAPPATRAIIAARGRGPDPGNRSASHPPRTPTGWCTESDRPPAPAARDRCARRRQTDAHPETPNLPEASPQPTCSAPRDQVVAMSALIAMITAYSKHRFEKPARVCVEAGLPHDERR